MYSRHADPRQDVLDLLAAGVSEQEILRDYPDLEPEDIRAPELQRLFNKPLVSYPPYLSSSATCCNSVHSFPPAKSRWIRPRQATVDPSAL